MMRLTFLSVAGIALLAAVLVPIGLPAADQNQNQDQNAEAVVRDLATRSANWITPPAALQTLEYDLAFGTEVKRVKVKRGEPRRNSVWMGATLHTGFHSLLQSPETFSIEVQRAPDAKTFTIVAKPKDGKGSIRVEVGNGVENSWRGYFSHGAWETSIVIDAERLVPLEERTGATTFRFSDWQDVGGGKYVPRRIDVLGASSHYRMDFAWLDDAVWLLRSSESITPEATVPLTRAKNVTANGRLVSAPSTDAENQSREAARAIVAMLDHNRPWLEAGANGDGWRPSFKTLSYAFRTEREGVVETAVIDAGGELVVEVLQDDQGRMKDRLGERRTILNSSEYAVSRRDARFARIFGRSDRQRGQPYDLALKNYARIGCQLDLPLFRCREVLDAAAIEAKDGTWKGRPCRVATISAPGGPVLGCGTMFAFTSWSYIHDIRPEKQVVYIDAERNLPLHETLTSSRDKRDFEIDYADHVEVEPGQWAPLSIRIESKDYFTCEYRFQLVAGRHWMLKEVVSWFKPEEKSRGVIEDVRVDGDRKPLDDALRQVQAARDLFAGAGEPDGRTDVSVVPFDLGRVVALGPYEVQVTMAERYQVVVTVTTADRDAPGTVPIGFVDEKGRLLFAPSVTLAEHGGARRGAVTLRASRAWRDVRSIIAPLGVAAVRKPIAVVPLRWGEPIAVNVPDARQGGARDTGEKTPREALTRAYQVTAERREDGTAALILDLVSIDGTHEFVVDLSAALLADSGEVVASGGLTTDLRVESNAVEKRFEISLGKLHEGVVPTTIAIGVAPGDVISAPMGSRWGMFLRNEAPFDVPVLLASPDEGARRVGLETLAWQNRNHSAFEGDGTSVSSIYRKTLQPFSDSLARIARESGPVDVRVDAARFLAFSEANGAAGVLGPLAEDDDARVREAAVVGLTFLGRSDHLETLRSIVDRGASLPERRAASVERDAIIALAHQRSDTAVDILGAALVGDLKRLKLVDAGTQNARLEGRLYRAAELCKLLGRTNNPRAYRWLASADDVISGRSDLAEHFAREGLVDALLRFPDQARDRISEGLESGDSAAAWARALSNSRDADFLPSIRRMLRRQDVTEGAKYSAVQYLWNLGSSEAVEALVEAYDRRELKSQPRSWMRLCEALAANGDGRGLPDAFEVLRDLKQPAERPLDEQKRKHWEHDRDRRREAAEDVFKRASRQVLASFLDRKTDVVSPADQEIVLRLLWRLPALPKPFARVVPSWAESADPKVAELAGRLVDRE